MSRLPRLLCSQARVAGKHQFGSGRYFSLHNNILYILYLALKDAYFLKDLNKRDEGHKSGLCISLTCGRRPSELG